MVMSNLITTEILRRVEQFGRAIVEADVPEHFKDQNHKLYFALVMLLRGHAQTLLRSVTVGNGVEAWRILVHRYERSDPQTQMNLLQVILKFETGDDLMKIMERLSEFEVLVDKYESIPGAERLQQSLRAAIIVQTLPEPLNLEVPRADEQRDFYNLREDQTIDL
jgi:hypothetical protein